MYVNMNGKKPTKKDFFIVFGAYAIVGSVMAILLHFAPSRYTGKIWSIGIFVGILIMLILVFLDAAGTSVSEFLGDFKASRATKKNQDKDNSEFSPSGVRRTLPGEASENVGVLFSNTDRPRRHSADMEYIFNQRYMPRDPRILISEAVGETTYQLLRKDTVHFVRDIFDALEVIKKPVRSAESSANPQKVFTLTLLIPPTCIYLSQFFPTPLDYIAFGVSVLAMIGGCAYFLQNISANISVPQPMPPPKPLCLEYDQSSPTLIGRQENIALFGKAMFKNNSKIHVKQSPYVLQNESPIPFSLSSSAVHCNFNVWQIDIWCGKLIFLPDCLAQFSKDDDFIQSFKYSELKIDRGTIMNAAEPGQTVSPDNVTSYLTIYCEERNFQFCLVSPAADVIDQAQPLLQRVLLTKR